MVATLIRLPENEYTLYKELARERGVSLAEYFRTAARKAAGKKGKTPQKYSIFDLGTKVVYRGGPRDGSVNHDKYYYEYEERKMRRYRIK
jgi:hypothetical protein